MNSNGHLFPPEAPGRRGPGRGAEKPTRDMTDVIRRPRLPGARQFHAGRVAFQSSGAFPPRAPLFPRTPSTQPMVGGGGRALAGIREDGSLP